MEKEFIPYQEALELKALGFDEECFKCKVIGEEHLDYTPSDYNDFPEQKEVEVLIPTFSQSFRFFRDKYNLHSYVSLGVSDEQGRSGSEYDEYTFIIEGINGIDYDNYGNEFFTNNYEEAELACLRKLIEIVKSI